jgi:hypothetical protein
MVWRRGSSKIYDAPERISARMAGMPIPQRNDLEFSTFLAKAIFFKLSIINFSLQKALCTHVLPLRYIATNMPEIVMQRLATEQPDIDGYSRVKGSGWMVSNQCALSYMAVMLNMTGSEVGFHTIPFIYPFTIRLFQ